jgi:hypothetical protein
MTLSMSTIRIMTDSIITLSIMPIRNFVIDDVVLGAVKAFTPSVVMLSVVINV